MTIACSSHTPLPPIPHTSQNTYNGLKEMLLFLKALSTMGFMFKFNTNGLKNHIEVKTENLKDLESHILDPDSDSTKMTFTHVETKNNPNKKNLLQFPLIDTTGLNFDTLMIIIGKLMGILAKLHLPKDSKKVSKALEQIETKIETKVSKTPIKDTPQLKTTQIEKLRMNQYKHELARHDAPMSHIPRKAANYHVKINK